MMQAPETLVKKTRVSGALAEADGNRTRRGPFDPPPVLKTGEPTRRSVASGKQSSGRFEVPVPGDLPLGGRLSRLGRVPPKGGPVSRQPQTSSLWYTATVCPAKSATLLRRASGAMTSTAPPRGRIAPRALSNDSKRATPTSPS